MSSDHVIGNGSAATHWTHRELGERSRHGAGHPHDTTPPSPRGSGNGDPDRSSAHGKHGDHDLASHREGEGG